MNIWLSVLVILLVVPLFMIYTGRRFVKKGAPKNIETVFSYHTQRAVKSWDTWSFAHNELGKLWTIIGLILIPVAAGLHAVSIRGGIDEICIFGLLIIAVEIIAIIVSVIIIESKLKKNFNDRGERTEESLAALAQSEAAAAQKAQKKQNKATAKASR